MKWLGWILFLVSLVAWVICSTEEAPAIAVSDAKLGKTVPASPMVSLDPVTVPTTMNSPRHTVSEPILNAEKPSEATSLLSEKIAALTFQLKEALAERDEYRTKYFELLDARTESMMEEFMKGSLGQSLSGEEMTRLRSLVKKLGYLPHDWQIIEYLRSDKEYLNTLQSLLGSAQPTPKEIDRAVAIWLCPIAETYSELCNPQDDEATTLSVNKYAIIPSTVEDRRKLHLLFESRKDELRRMFGKDGPDKVFGK